MTERGLGALIMFENRLRKLKKEREKWAKKNSIECYRIYSEDIPQVACILDRYPNGFVLYDKSSLRFKAESDHHERLTTIQAIIRDVFQLSESDLFLKQRQKQKGKDQYEKFALEGNFFWVKESNLEFRINLTDYLDTGLFLDHRVTRGWIKEKSKNQSILNLFSYTGAFSVYAASGGAKKTKSVDLSKTYCDWAKQNLERNGFGGQNHQIINADILKWIEDETRNANRERYDLIFLDPPTFSNSKKMYEEWDVQAKHKNLLLLLLSKFLNENGEIWFSTNFRKFKMEVEDEEWKERGYICTNKTKDSIPLDFRDDKIHQLFCITPNHDVTI
ncbi:methyltransferase domain protein [Leptospira yanagawae serovar Saopaulo str. Sao Paulo = ATCC 700523]|uniref:Methyltransferase domain protein n=1 Tax=Leptospira yanagawae serovar Saopaulo str. Sao Paulo = ATCC 700523 TaxID=1249483 RepID=A0A5E8HHX7_9LEPT|nr:class I SAM-dependent methyltransferase [Leptospira yanagawae]EOQ90218.1 methyltransferase domain protein [Leptospira yanagawae serovar Saopaulo str. Sao Paulo = ATCC 700523]